MSDYIIVGGELCHYGVKGMKWGVRRFRDADGKVTPEGRQREKEYRADRKEQNEAARKVSVTRSNLVKAYSEHEYARGSYESAAKAHAKAKGRLFKSDEEIELTKNEVEEWAEAYKVSKTAVNKAARMYNEDRKKLVKQTNRMIEKYGSENVQQISKSDYSIGRNRTLKLVDTGTTLADLPIIGPAYAERHIASLALKENKREMNYKSKVDSMPRYSREFRREMAKDFDG